MQYFLLSEGDVLLPSDEYYSNKFSGISAWERMPASKVGEKVGAGWHPIRRAFGQPDSCRHYAECPTHDVCKIPCIPECFEPKKQEG